MFCKLMKPMLFSYFCCRLPLQVVGCHIVENCVFVLFFPSACSLILRNFDSCKRTYKGSRACCWLHGALSKCHPYAFLHPKVIKLLWEYMSYVTYSLATRSKFKPPTGFPRLANPNLITISLQKLFIVTVYQTAFNHSTKATSAASFGYHFIFDSLHQLLVSLLPFEFSKWLLNWTVTPISLTSKRTKVNLWSPMRLRSLQAL